MFLQLYHWIPYTPKRSFGPSSMRLGRKDCLTALDVPMFIGDAQKEQNWKISM